MQSPRSPLDPERSSSDGKFWSWTTFTNKARAVLLEDGIPTSENDSESRKDPVLIQKEAVENPPSVDQVCELSRHYLYLNPSRVRCGGCS